MLSKKRLYRLFVYAVLMVPSVMIYAQDDDAPERSGWYHGTSGYAGPEALGAIQNERVKNAPGHYGRRRAHREGYHQYAPYDNGNRVRKPWPKHAYTRWYRKRPYQHYRSESNYGPVCDYDKDAWGYNYLLHDTNYGYHYGDYHMYKRYRYRAPYQRRRYWYRYKPYYKREVYF